MGRDNISMSPNSQGFHALTTINDVNQLGLMIKQVRKSKKISQPEMARRANCARNTIFNIENGENVAIDIIFRVLKELEISLQFAEKTLPAANEL